MTNKGQIIKQLLDWRDPISGIRLETHIEKEARRLRNYLEQKPQLRPKYEEWSGDIATSIPPHAKEVAALLRRWRSETNLDAIVIGERDKTVISDAGEFVMMPFMRFSGHYHDVVGAIANGEADEIAFHVAEEPRYSDESIAVSNAKYFSERARVRNGEYNKLGNLFFALCDTQDYPVAGKLRTELRNPPERHR